MFEVSSNALEGFEAVVDALNLRALPIAAGIGLGLLTINIPLGLIWAYVLYLLLGVPTGIVVLAVWMVRRWRKRRQLQPQDPSATEPRRSTRTEGVMIVIALHIITCLSSLAIHEVRVEKAKAFCNALVPRLDSMRTANGGYPITIEPLFSSLPDRPYYLKDVTFYRSDTNRFSFEFDDPDKFPLPCDWGYDSEYRRWGYND